MNVEENKTKNLFYLNLVNTALILFVSIFGILNQQIYNQRMNKMTLYELKGQDIFTFIIGIALLLSTICAYSVYTHNTYNRRKTAKIVLLGCLTYTIYIYAYFCFSALTSILFIIYIVILGLSFFCFIYGLLDLKKDKNILLVTASYPRKTISIFLLIIIAIMYSIEIKDIIDKTMIQTGTFIPKDGFYIIDMSFLFPSMGIASVMNFKKNVWGYVFSGVFLVKIITLLPAIILSDFLLWNGTGKFADSTFDIIAFVITFFAAIIFIKYVKSIEH